jgi:hypothetical protein
MNFFFSCKFFSIFGPQKLWIRINNEYGSETLIQNIVLQIVNNEVWWLCRRATTTTMKRTGVITMKMDIITTTTMKKVSKL